MAAAETPDDLQEPNPVERVHQRMQRERANQTHPFHHTKNLSMIAQVMSLVGAFLVLGAYFALQRGWLAGEDRLFNLLNFIGAGMLTWVAIEDRRVGFILLEGAWALLSLPGASRRRGSPPSGRATGQ